MNEDEIQKLMNHGDGWLADHPAKERIVKRYFGVKKGMARLLIFYRVDEHDPKRFFEIPNQLPQSYEVMPNY